MSRAGGRSTGEKAAVRRVLGIDPGLRCTGYGIIEMSGGRTKVITFGVIKPPAGTDFFHCLNLIREGISGVIEEHHPLEMAVEEIFYHRNVKAALTLGHARGAAIVAGLEGGLEAFQYTALQVKKAVVGYGRAEKSQVQTMLKTLLSLEEVPRPEDASDALAVALTHCHWKNL